MSEKKSTPVKPVTPKQTPPKKAPINKPRPKVTPLKKDAPPPPSRGIGRPPKN